MNDAQYKKDYYERNKSAILEKQKNYKSKNKERLAARSREYYMTKRAAKLGNVERLIEMAVNASKEGKSETIIRNIAFDIFKAEISNIGGEQ